MKGRILQFAKQKIVLKEKDLISLRTEEHGYCKKTERFEEFKKDEVTGVEALMGVISKTKAEQKGCDGQNKKLKWIYSGF